MDFLFSLLGPSTKALYELAIGDLNLWLGAYSADFWEAPEEEQDYALVDYILDGKDSGWLVPSRATDTLAAVQKVFGGRRKMRAATTVVVGWKSMLPTDPAVPMPRPVALATAVVAAALGFTDIAVATLLAFVGVMRIGVPLGLLVRDVAFPEQHLSGDFMVVILAKGKNFPGETERVIIGDAQVMDPVRGHLQATGRRPGERLCNISYGVFSRHLGMITSGLGFAPRTFRSHSLRRGAASTLVLQNVPTKDIMILGRWASEHSCSLSLKAGAVALTRMSAAVSPNQWQKILAIARRGPRVFRQDFPSRLPCRAKGSSGAAALL